MSNRLTGHRPGFFYKTTKSRQPMTSAASSRPLKTLKTPKIIGSQLQKTQATHINTRVSKTIFRELQALQDLDTLDLTKDANSRTKFLKNFDWKDSTLARDEIARIEELLVEFHDVFARHRFDIGMNEEITVELTPKDNSPAYRQRLPAPINLKEDIVVELAMLH